MARSCLAVALTVLVAVYARQAAAPDFRTLWIRSVHLHEELRLAPFGTHGLVRTLDWLRLDRLFRSHRTLKARAIHPRLLRVLAQIQRHFGGRRLELLSG